jgi:Mn-dependent DtxR family transcriptional regulator
VSSLPADAQDDVDVALIVHTLLDQATIRTEDLAPLLQKSEGEALAALRRAEGYGLVTPTLNTSRYRRPHFRFTDDVRNRLRPRLDYLTTSAEEAEEHVVRHLATSDTIASSDIQEMLGVRPVQASRIFRALRDAGVITLGSAKETGRGVFYVRGPRFNQAAKRHGITIR